MTKPEVVGTPAEWLAERCHPAAALFPFMPENEQAALTEDIRLHGLASSIILWAEGKQDEPLASLDDALVLDGRNRMRSLAALGCQFMRHTQGRMMGMFDITKLPLGSATFLLLRAQHADGTPWVDPWEYVLSANVHRRHLSTEQKRDLIAKVLAEKPALSNRRIGKLTRTDDKTVGSVRKDMERRAEIPHVSTRQDSKGRQQPAAKPTRPQPVVPMVRPVVEATINPPAPSSLGARIIARFGDTEWHPVAEVAADLQASRPQITSAIAVLLSNWQTSGVHCERRRVGTEWQIRIYTPTNRMVGSVELAQKLAPLIDEIVHEIKKHRAEFSPGSIGQSCSQMRKLLREWTE